jgi:hypothetical protein
MVMKQVRFRFSVGLNRRDYELGSQNCCRESRGNTVRYVFSSKYNLHAKCCTGKVKSLDADYR